MSHCWHRLQPLPRPTVSPASILKWGSGCGGGMQAKTLLWGGEGVFRKHRGGLAVIQDFLSPVDSHLCVA